jgi:hypothetical protein
MFTESFKHYNLLYNVSGVPRSCASGDTIYDLAHGQNGRYIQLSNCYSSVYKFYKHLLWYLYNILRAILLMQHEYFMCPTKKRAVAWIQSFLEPFCRQGGGEWRVWPASLRKKESVGTQQRWGKHEEKCWKINSRHHGGSAANRVRRSLLSNR